MSYKNMSEESSISSADSLHRGSQPTDNHTAPSTPSTPPATLTITREGAQQPTVLAVHTSSTLTKKDPIPASNLNGTGDTGVTKVMTSQQAHKRQLAVSSSEDNSSFPSASNLKDFECPAGDRYKIHTSQLEQFRANVKRLTDHLVFRAITLILICVDLSIVIVSVVKAEKAKGIYEALEVKEDATVRAELNYLEKELDQLDFVAIAFSSYFIIEVACRIFAQTPRVFFRQILEIIDAVVVLISFIVVLVDVAIDKNDAEYIKIIGALRLVRVVRFAMLLRVVVTQRKQLLRATRLVVSENKRRFQKDGFDLDLCYITDHMIAMSFPSQGLMSIYRNPIEEVSRFFNSKYYGSYRVYNCCSERSYDEAKYFNNAVVRILIDDHNVPSLQQIIDFVKDVEQWRGLNKDNVIAIHCKGGKGRTGTMVAIWLLHTRTFDKADDALDYFGSRRTDLSVDSKFQGVETPSQSRYVNYYEKMLSQYGGQIPEEVKLRPSKISVAGLRGIGDENGKDLIMQLIIKGETIYEARFGTNTNCTAVFERDSATITASLINAPVIAGDIKVRFEATSNIPCAYDGCPWFFWFNTSFIEGNRISLGREDLDNPHQKKAWKLYKEDFRVTLQFGE